MLFEWIQPFSALFKKCNQVAHHQQYEQKQGKCRCHTEQYEHAAPTPDYLANCSMPCHFSSSGLSAKSSATMREAARFL
jgi:hypothetical protein